MSITLQSEGRRIYLVGNTFAAKDQIKAIGGHWDADRKAWWVGSQNREAAEKIASDAPKQDYVPTPIKRSDRVFRKVRYAGKNGGAARTYYVVAESRSGKFRLTTLDMSIDFWADASACETVKVYQGHSRFGGYGRGQIMSYPTIGSIADFVQDARQADREIAQGRVPEGYSVDLEDGCVKRTSECDIPATH